MIVVKIEKWKKEERNINKKENKTKFWILKEAVKPNYVLIFEAIFNDFFIGLIKKIIRKIIVSLL